MKNVTVSLDDDTYRAARRRAAEDGRSLSSMVREAIQEFGSEESETDRQARIRGELVETWRREGIGIDLSNKLTRDQLYDRELSRLVLSDAYK